MANSLLPPEERFLTPDQVEALDKRRDLGHTFLVIAGQFAVIAAILLLWVGQDLTLLARLGAPHLLLLPRRPGHHRGLRHHRLPVAPGNAAAGLTPL